MAEKDRKRYVIALPRELSSSAGNVIGYAEIPKQGVTIATTAEGAVSDYLHRDGVRCSNTNLIIQKLNEAGGDEKAAKYVLCLSDIVSEGASLGPDDKEIAEEVLAADFFSKRYGGEDSSYLKQARELLEGFRHFDEWLDHQ